MKNNVFCGNLFWKTLYIAVCVIFSSYVGLFALAAPVMADDNIAADDNVSTDGKASVQELPPGFVDDAILATTPGMGKDTSVGDAANTTVETYAPGTAKTFIISAYYSPLPGQVKYVTGTYNGDVRLNGDGVKAADGTQVYPGMVAAPKGYAFGYKMLIPGIGTVAVHDRGGAIVNSGVRGNSYDRLDVWMGYGDAGLKRALKWGKRTVGVTLYGVNSDIKESVSLEGYTEDEKFMVANTLTFNNDAMSAASVTDNTGDFTFGSVLSLGSAGDDVKKLQEKLKAMNYYSGEISGNFDGATLQAVKRYQLDKNIIDQENAYGAGYVGPTTTKVLASDQIVSTAHAATEEITVSNVFTSDLKLGDQGDNVRTLQEELKKINLFGIEPTGIYGDLTAHAVFKFQQINSLAGDENSHGAGIFGPMTRQKLNDLVSERVRTEKMIADRKKDD